MLDALTLTYAQYEAIPRLLSSLKQSQRDNVKSMHIEVRDDPTDYIRVTFDAGWGTLAYDIDEEGNSAHVAFGGSEISG